MPEFRRLFRGERLSAGRRQRLAQCPSLAAMRQERTVGLAVYEHVNRDLWVHELVTLGDATTPAADIVGALLCAIETATLASGGERVVLTARAAPSGPIFARCGYRRIDEGCAGRWLQKVFTRSPAPGGRSGQSP